MNCTGETARGLEDLIKDSSLPITRHYPSGERAVIAIYVPDDQLGGFVQKIRELPGIDQEDNIVEVSNLDFVISTKLDELKKEQEAKQPEEKKKSVPLVEQLIESTDPHTVFDSDKVVLAAIAGVVALIGLFLNNVGVIIGAMLISPLLGPIYAFSVNAAVGNSIKVFRCIRIIASLLLMVVLISFVATVALSFFTTLTITPEISSRLTAAPIFVVMGGLLGFATILALVKGIPEGIAGVAVAAALLPPAVVIGIALAIAPASAIKAVTLTLQNIFGLITGALVALIVLQVRPRTFIEQWRAKQFLKRIAWVLAVLIILIVILTYLV